MQSTSPEFVIDSIEDLCDRCKDIKFDDAGFGGVEEVSAIDGKSRLGFPETIPGLEHGMQWFETPYHLEDQLPQLPVLGESATRGCQFCLFVKAVILTKDVGDMIINDKTDLTVKIGYLWNALEDCKPYEGLSYMYLKIGPNHKAGFHLWIVCLIEDCGGM